MESARNYGIITAAYWAFTLTDGALRMLVLLHLHELGIGALLLAAIFLAYELMGVVTNGLGGWIGSRTGLKATLISGLMLQVAACSMLRVEDAALTVLWLTLTQVLSGVAKDLTKMSAKSYIKLVVPEDQSSQLMRWVSWLTGSKNALKGAGFFLGAWSLGAFGFQETCGVMALGLVVAALAAGLSLPPRSGRSQTKLPLKELIPDDPRITWLSVARLFLFGSRDAWFVLALPLFASSALGWSHDAVGGLLAAWVMGYGVIQASAPGWVSRGDGPPGARTLGVWTLLLLGPLLGLEVLLGWFEPSATAILIALAVFGAVFAANSAIHSYLIVSYADRDGVSARVGFYYMANAAGRALGTVLSGALYQASGAGAEGLFACVAASVILVALSAVATQRLVEAEERVTAHERPGL